MSNEAKIGLKLELRLKQLASVEAEMFDELMGKGVFLELEGIFAYGTLAGHGTNFVKMVDVIEATEATTVEDTLDAYLKGNKEYAKFFVEYPSKLYNKAEIASVREKARPK